MPTKSQADREWTPTEHGRDARGLGRKVTRGLMWTLIDTWGSQLLAFVIFAILARLLDPLDFGLVALAAVFVALGQLFVDQGLGDAVIQRASLTRRQLDTAFWATLATGSLLAVAGIVLAPLIATLLGEDRLAPIIQALSLVFVLVALTSIQMGLLRRELDFRGLAIRKLLAIGIGGVVGIAMALMGYGAWALVGQQLAAAAISIVALWAVTPWRPGFQFSRADFRSLFSFGINVVASDLLGFLSRNMDNLLIGVFLGPIALGFYAIAYRILDTSQILLVAFARRLIFPTFSRLQHDLDRVRNVYLRVARSSAAVIIPGYVGLALVASEAIVVVFGDKWQPSVAAAALLFTIGPALSLQAYSGSVWSALGRPDVTLRFRLLTTIANVIGFVIAVLLFKTIVAVAAAFVLRSYLLLPLNLWWMQRYGNVPVASQLTQLRGVIVASLVMAAAVVGIKVVVGDALVPAALLALEVILGSLAYGLALLVVDRPLMRELIRIAAQVIPGGGRLAARFGIRIERRRRAEMVEATADGDAEPLV